MDDTTDIKKQYEIFLKTFDEGEQPTASMIINYIVRQLNNESLKADVPFEQYRSLVVAGVKGLFKLIYLDFFDFAPDKERMHRLIRADVIFTSANNFMLMLFTRVFMGKDRELIIKQIESSRPLFLSQQQGVK